MPGARNSLQIGEWRVEPSIDEIQCARGRVKLEPRTMALLVYLAEHAGEVVSAEELLDHIWRGVVVAPSSVYQSVAVLRRALGDSSDEPRYIVNVPRKGYRLIAPVRFLDTHERPERQPRRRRLAWRLATVTVIVALGLAFLLLPETLRDRIVGVGGGERTVAVLPFEDLSGDAARDRLADGLTDDLLNTLGQLPGVRATARTSVFAYKDRRADVRQIGRDLNVRYIVNGSLRRERDRVRVAAQLVDARSGFEIWSRTYERPTSEILEVQGEIARAIVQHLELLLTREDVERLARSSARPFAAYELLLEGRARLNERTGSSQLRAREAFQRVLAAASRDVDALVGIAHSYLNEFYYANRPIAEAASLMTPLLDRALEIDPQHADAFALRGILKVNLGDDEAAFGELERAIAIAPSHANAWLWLGIARYGRGDVRRALAAHESAVTLDPLNFIAHIREGLMLEALGRHTEAARSHERAIELAPSHPNPYWAMAALATERGDLPAARDWYLKALQADATRSDLALWLALLELDLGYTDDARERLASIDLAATNATDRHLARAFLALSNGERASLATIADGLEATAPDNAFVLADAALIAYLGGANGAAAHRLDAVRRERGLGFPIHSTLRLRMRVLQGESALVHVMRMSGDVTGSAAVEREFAGILQRYEGNGMRYHGIHYLRAAFAAQRGAHDEALTHLQRAVARGWRGLWWVQHDPSFAGLHSTPGFRALIEQLRADIESQRNAAAAGVARS